MRIGKIRKEVKCSRVRVVASIQWEDCDRSSQEIYFETDGRFEPYLSCSAHAYVAGCLLPALRHGEGRIAIEEPICPRFRNGLLANMKLLETWYGKPKKPLDLETRPGRPAGVQRKEQRVGLFLSGGVDSLSTLRLNRLDYPLDHPRSVQDGLVVYGFDIGGLREWKTEDDIFERATKSLEILAKDTQIQLIPISTNLRHLDDDIGFWQYEFHGAALAAVGHILSSRLSTVLISSTYDVHHLKPWGSHPLLDSNYGSADLEILHDGLPLSRLEKVRIVSEWAPALANMRVCTMNEPEKLNCGRCEKCLRTIAELDAIGKLGEASAFQADETSLQMLDSVKIAYGYQNACWRELIPCFVAQGRHDLARKIRWKSTRFEIQDRLLRRWNPRAWSPRKKLRWKSTRFEIQDMFSREWVRRRAHK